MAFDARDPYAIEPLATVPATAGVWAAAFDVVGVVTPTTFCDKLVTDGGLARIGVDGPDSPLYRLRDADAFAQSCSRMTWLFRSGWEDRCARLLAADAARRLEVWP